MAKLKTSDTLSLDKSKQKKLVKQTNKLKKNIKDGKVIVKRLKPQSSSKDRGLIYIGHIPHGFYEKEMKDYFKQFGAVTNVKVGRSNRTGRSKGFGYVEFAHPEVAKIAAETMNNYLMFKKRIVAEYVPDEKRPQHLFKGRSSTVKRYSSKVRREKQRIANLNIDDATHLKRSNARLLRLNTKLKKLKNVGIDYDFKPASIPEGVEEKVENNDNFEPDTVDSDIEIKVSSRRKSVSHVFELDPYDSDIEIKVPSTPKSKTLRTPKKEVSKKTSNVTTKLKPPKKTPKRGTSEKTPKVVKPKLESPKRTGKKTSPLKRAKPSSIRSGK